MASEDALEFAIVLDHEVNPPGKRATLAPFAVAKLAHDLMRAAASLHRRYEAACSYEWATTEAYERATSRKEAGVAKLLAGTVVAATFERDPRGAPIKLKLPSGKSNAWGGEGYCVPVKS